MATSYLELYQEGEVEISTCPTPQPGKFQLGLLPQPLLAAIIYLCIVCGCCLFSVVEHGGHKRTERKKAEVSEDEGLLIGGCTCSFNV